jgi:hypothetical protein
MAIIKFKDKIHTNDEGFNISLKNKYAYWIQFKYVIPFSEITTEKYIELERDGICIDKIEAYKKGDLRALPFNLWFSDELTEYIDFKETEKFQNFDKLEKYNKSIGSIAPNLTTDKIKDTRTFLLDTFIGILKNADATTLDAYTYKNKDLILRALEYFKNGGLDKEFSKILNDIDTILNNNFNNSGSSGNSGITDLGSCGCLGNIPNNTPNQNLQGGFFNAYNITGSTLVNNYHTGMMVILNDFLKNPDFWILNLDTSDHIELKEYLEGIIKLGLDIPAYTATFKTDVNNMIQVLTYIIDQDLIGHKNFIRDSIYKFVNYVPFLKF